MSRMKVVDGSSESAEKISCNSEEPHALEMKALKNLMRYGLW